MNLKLITYLIIMSKSFIKSFIIYFTKYILHEQSSTLNSSIMLYCGGIGLSLHSSYVILTSRSKIINVDKKYKFVRNGFTEFMIIDDNGQHYNVNNSFWYLKWNSCEDWHKIETNKKFIITYYGCRIPFLGIFPNIVRTTS